MYVYIKIYHRNWLMWFWKSKSPTSWKARVVIQSKPSRLRTWGADGISPSLSLKVKDPSTVSKSRRKKTSPLKQTRVLPPPFYSIQTLSGLDGGYPYWGRLIFTQSTDSIVSRDILTDTPRNNDLPAL